MKTPLAPREKEIMDIIYRLGCATVAEVRDQMAEPPSYSAVRATLNVLERKGHLKHRHQGKRYEYLPTVAKQRASLSALDHLMSTFFDDSAEEVVTALLRARREDLSPEVLQRLSRLIEQARKEGR